MRAVVCHEFATIHDLVLEDIEPPALADDQVRIKVMASGVSFATGLIVAGKYQRKPPRPFVPGAEIAGEVIAVGAAVTRFNPGERVFAGVDWGGWAEQAVAKDIFTHHIPDGLDFAQATLLPLSYPTSYAALNWKANLRDNETVLVHGSTGAVGLAAVEIAKARGARVIATASTPEKRQLATDHGADFTIGYEGLREAVKEITEGHGADIIFDPIGGDVFMESLRCTAREGRLITIGYASGTIPEPPVNFLLVKNMSIIGLNYGTYVGWSPGDDGTAYADDNAALHEDMKLMIEAGKLRPTVTFRFPLDEFIAAYEAVESRISVGKVVVEPQV